MDTFTFRGLLDFSNIKSYRQFHKLLEKVNEDNRCAIKSARVV